MSTLLVLLVALVSAGTHYEQGVATVVGAAALVTAALYLFRQVRRAFQWVETIHHLTTRELEHTDGPDSDSTMKDDLHGVAVALGRLQRRVDHAAAQVGRNSQRLDLVEADLRIVLDPLQRNRERNSLDSQPREDI